MASGSKSPSTALRGGDCRTAPGLWGVGDCNERAFLWEMIDGCGWFIGWEGARRPGENAKAWEQERHTKSADNNNLFIVMDAVCFKILLYCDVHK
mmetsp:Transcript_26736/g.55021  ORF Transcript_26736/g.55021 Transcript_26736/m.55021 type:complete len:95 (+) Transcript_26736:1148-1432(+)